MRFWKRSSGSARRGRSKSARRTQFRHPKGDAPLRPEGAIPRQRCGISLFSCETCRGGRPCPPAAPQARNSFPDSPEVPFLQRRCNCAFGDHIFSLLREKIWKKRALDAEIALTRRKANRSVVRFFRYTVRSPNALRATVESGFRIARYAVRSRYVCAR